jgi:hypothetical protein
VISELKENPAPSPAALSIEAADCRWSARIVYAALIVLIFLQLTPVWYFRFLPTQDGPAHVENAVILRDLSLGKPSSFSINPHPVPNWTGHALLAIFSTAVTPRVAEKFLVSLYVILLPICAAYAGRSIRKGGEWIGILLIPFIYSLALHKGLYNFCLSLALFFLLIGAAIRCWRKPTWRTIPLILTISLLLYFSHVVSLVMAIIVLSGLAAGTINTKRQEAESWRPTLQKLAILAAALSPALLLAAWFFLTSRGPAADRRPVGVQLLRFFELDALGSFRKPELLVAIAYSAALWLTTLIVLAIKTIKRRWTTWDGMLALVAITLAVYLAAPNSAAGGGQISFRLSLYPYFVLILWLAAQPIPSLIRAAAAAAATIACATFLILHWGTYARLNVYLKEYESIANHVEAGKTIIDLDRSRDSLAERKISWRIRPFWHAIGYVAAKKNLVNLGNYEVLMGYFPLQRRGLTTQHSSVDLTDDQPAIEERAALANAADYFVIWDLSGKPTLSDPAALQQLQRTYEVVYTSPHHWAKLYRKKVG